MSAEIAVSLIIIPFVIAALFKVDEAAGSSRVGKLATVLISTALLSLTYGVYQANVSVVITGMSIALLIYSCRMITENTPGSTRLFLRKGLCLIAVFIVSYAVYSIITKLFFSSSDYLSNQIVWSSKGVLACLHDSARYIRDVLFAKVDGSTGLLALGIVSMLMMQVLSIGRSRASFAIQALKYISLAMLCISPFLLGLYMGQPPIARTQFSAPIVAAFLIAASYTALPVVKWGKLSRLISSLIACCTVVLSVYSGALNLRNVYTDEVRFQQESVYANSLIADLRSSYSDAVSCKPVVFVGKWSAPLNPACKQTDMWGRTLFEHDYMHEGNAAYNTVRCAGFIQAVTGVSLISPTADQQSFAVDAAFDMPVYPANGSIVELDDIVVVNLGA